MDFENGRTKIEVVGSQSQPTLTLEKIRIVALVVSALTDYFGFYGDMEASFDTDDNLVVLQFRPITTIKQSIEKGRNIVLGNISVEDLLNQPLPPYTGAGASSIHRVLDNIEEMLRAEDTSGALSLSNGLIADLGVLQTAASAGDERAYAGIMDKWAKFTEVHVDLMAGDVESALNKARQLRAEALGKIFNIITHEVSVDQGILEALVPSDVNTQEVGGIDFRPEMLDIKTEGEGFNLRILPLEVSIEAIPNGLTPVIIQIIPVTPVQMPFILGTATLPQVEQQLTRN